MDFKVDAARINIGLLEGKENWTTWKYKMKILLRGLSGSIDLLEGRLIAPKEIEEKASKDEKNKYQEELNAFIKIDSNTLLVITVNLTQETLEKVMRFSSARDVWLELHRLYDGYVKDKTYDLCLEFFNYNKQPDTDIATHMSKLKNLWNGLQTEIQKDKETMGNKCTCELPPLLLICKILGTLPEEYFSFRSSWMLMSEKERTVENLTNQLCAYEKALMSRKREDSQEVLMAARVNNKKFMKREIICHYCKVKGHMVKQCRKWKNDGRPPKPSRNKQPNTGSNRKIEEEDIVNIVLMFNTTPVKWDAESWYVDNGATNHITSRKEFFETYTAFEDIRKVVTADGNYAEALGKGNVILKTYGPYGEESHERIMLKDVWYVPKIKKNLFSVLAAQDKNPNSEFVSSSQECMLKVLGKQVLHGRRCQAGGLFKLDVQTIWKTVNQNITHDNTLQLYHERFGHQNKKHVKGLLAREFGINVHLDSAICEGCQYGKAHRLKFGRRERATSPGVIIHTDVCGPFVESPSGYKYYVLFKDDYSRFRYVYFLKKKSEVASKLRTVLAEIKVAGHTVKEVLFDNGGEFDNGSIKEILEENGIKARAVMPYTPQQNGCSERENRTLVEMARAMLHSCNLPQFLWAEMVNTAAYILNRSGISSVVDKSPSEAWTGKKPRITHMKIIGSACYVHIPKQKRKKMDKKAIKGNLIGYDNDDGYRVWIANSRTLIRSRDIVFDEKPFNVSSFNIALAGNEKKEEEIKENKEEMENTEAAVRDENREETIIENEDNQDEDYNKRLRNRELLKKPEYLQDYNLSEDDLASAMSTITRIEGMEEPTNFEEATTSEQKEAWIEAMNKELESLHENNTWKLQNLPRNKKAIQCRWVYKVKTKEDGSINKFKARLVIKGYAQRKGIDFEEIFSPVAKTGSIRALLSIAAVENLQLTHFDVCTAFLYGNLKEEVYMKQPPGYEDGTERVCRLQRSLYGLKQAPRCWNKRITDFLEENGFIRCTADSCLFFKRHDDTVLILALYVDDGLLASNNEQSREEFLRILKKEFKITMEPASYFLGLEIKQDIDKIRIAQTHYTKKLLKRFRMENCNQVSSPILKENIKHNENDPEQEGQANKAYEQKDIAFNYREAVGALMYLMVCTRPDIAYAVSVLCRKLDNPSNNDYIKLKRIFRYLKGTIGYGIVYRPNDMGQKLIAYSDADYGGDSETGCSTSGVVCIFAGGAITWLSRRQSSVAISTTEAEIMAASEATKELLWLKQLYQELAQIQDVPTLFVDNEAAINLAKNPKYHQRTKHIKIRHFFVREQVSSGLIYIDKVSTKEQLADIFTKPLFKPRIKVLCKEMGMEINPLTGEGVEIQR